MWKIHTRAYTTFPILGRQDKDFLTHFLQEIEETLHDIAMGRSLIRNHKLELAIARDKLERLHRHFFQDGGAWDNEIVKKPDELEVFLAKVQKKEKHKPQKAPALISI